MADTLARKFCRKLSLSRSSAIYAKSLRYFTRYFSSEATGFSKEENKVSFVTCGCSIEELESVQDMVDGNLEIRDDFISEEEESLLVKEVEPYLKRQKYQYDHWDDAIHGYRETEKSRWSQESMSIFRRIKETAFKSDAKLLPRVHVLDLAKNGVIKPHIDSVKFCGDTICGLSLLSPSVMRFQHKEHVNVKVDALLNPRSLYIIRDTARYEFTHAILHEEESAWKGEVVPRDRRISLVLRCEPT